MAAIHKQPEVQAVVDASDLAIALACANSHPFTEGFGDELLRKASRENLRIILSGLTVTIQLPVPPAWTQWVAEHKR